MCFEKKTEINSINEQSQNLETQSIELQETEIEAPIPIGNDTLEQENEFLSKFSKDSFPTDRGHYERERDSTILKFIIRIGPCRPKLDKFPKHKKANGSEYYNNSTQAGFCVPRSWLYYSVKNNS